MCIAAELSFLLVGQVHLAIIALHGAGGS
jgi:hypothetical protein